MTCPLHTPIPICVSRKKPRGWFQGKVSYYEDEIWETSLERGGIGWANKYSAEQYGLATHGEWHGAKTLDEALQLGAELQGARKAFA